MSQTELILINHPCFLPAPEGLRFLHSRERSRWITLWRPGLKWSRTKYYLGSGPNSSEPTRAGSACANVCLMDLIKFCISGSSMIKFPKFETSQKLNLSTFVFNFGILKAFFPWLLSWSDLSGCVIYVTFIIVILSYLLKLDISCKYKFRAKLI